eukprot:366452-Chlamydomonas_euryale.AAC.8
MPTHLAAAGPALVQDSKDGAEMSWEEAINLSDDVVRDYDDKWWAAATKVRRAPAPAPAPAQPAHAQAPAPPAQPEPAPPPAWTRMAW